MTDRYAQIRKALAMGPTPGPRRVIDGDSHPYVTVALPENEGHRWDDPIVCTLYEDVTPDDYIGFGERLQPFPNARANAALIAACDPDTTRALLDERDALEAENERLQAEVERLHRLLGRIVEGDGDSTLTIRAGTDAFAAAREYLSAPKPAPYNRKRIAWELERTAMGDGYYGDALRAAKEFPEAAPLIRTLLDRWATGREVGLSDRTDLCAFAQQIYMSDGEQENKA